ncbi:MAG: polysaccharide biosynthesis protein [Eubacteriaceae bacterium]|nr:polysaccharide biosynthesis protein [Eubacteriaceae bacterium]
MNRMFKIMVLLICDIILLNISYLLSLYMRFDNQIHPVYFNNYFRDMLIIITIKIFIFWIFGLYKRLWIYAGTREVIEISAAVLMANLLVILYGIFSKNSLPLNLYLLIILTDIMVIGGSRLLYRFIHGGLPQNGNHNKKKRILIVGAGDAGAAVIWEIKNNSQVECEPTAVVDDDPHKQGLTIYGIPVKGTLEDIEKIVREDDIDEIIIAVPTLCREKRQQILEVCNRTTKRIRIYPSMQDIIDGKVSIGNIRDVRIDDLLGREPINLSNMHIETLIAGKTVLVTGAGGSIGSELCRQIALYNPEQLMGLDIYENSLFELQMELKSNFKGINFRAIVASVTNETRINGIFDEFRPDIVFHAAAHKHVPLMEENPEEAVRNNVFGTLNLIKAADHYRVKKFVLISTDKAVNPTNIMGATKRICEMLIQTMDSKSKTDFSAVRFGNVLGSNGSVIPIFKKQIEKGGPVTVTHPDIIRYFMSLPEAVQLVLTAGAMAKGGEIFILDMGDPVKIMDLAVSLIHLSGFEEDKDISIEIVGLRPGEKLFEELLMDEEGITDTCHEKIFIGKPIFNDYKDFMKKIDRLIISLDDESNDIREMVKGLVPNYQNGHEDANADYDKKVM